MKYWFMSYLFALYGRVDDIHFGCCTVDDGEHPIAKIRRWQLEMYYRKFVLLSFQEITEEEAMKYGHDSEF